VTENWSTSFFDADYVRLWSQSIPEARSAEEADFLWRTLDLRAGSRVLDAPCGYGRIARLLAGRGSVVLGVDVHTLTGAPFEARGPLLGGRVTLLAERP